MRPKRIAWFLAAALLVPSAAALASGTYRAGPARASDSIDREAYNQGKQLFAGKATPTGDGSAHAEQLAVLRGWHERLPASVTRTRDLKALAGTLSDEQLEQLGYFLKLRYKIE